MEALEKLQPKMCSSDERMLTCVCICNDTESSMWSAEKATNPDKLLPSEIFIGDQAVEVTLQCYCLGGNTYRRDLFGGWQL